MKFKTVFQNIVLWLCLLGLVKASCTSYGHSCWGAHGKRSNVQPRRPENDWKLLKFVPENNDQLKSDINSQMDIGNFLNTLKTQDEKMLDPPTLTSDESQNNIGQRFPKKKYRLKLFNKPPTDTSSNENFSLDSQNWNVAVRDEYKVPNYRLLKMLRRDMFN